VHKQAKVLNYSIFGDSMQVWRSVRPLHRHNPKLASGPQLQNCWTSWLRFRLGYM